MAINRYCLPCEEYDRWIEIDLRDEHNRSFKGQKVTLTDATGKSVIVTMKDGPTLVEGFAVGPVTIKLETQPWLKAARSREALKEGETNQVPGYTDKIGGHCDVKREHVKVTSGDLSSSPLFGRRQLPEGHQAGQAQPPRFITGHSYVIEVKGYRLTTLRIGLFFDGTSNSTFKHREGKPQMEAFLAQCSADERDAWLEKCLYGELPQENDSEKNDMTNIGKAHELYQLPTLAALNVPVYIEGIGASKGEDDETMSTGGDGGSASSSDRVVQACRTRIVEELKEQLERILPTIECIGRIEFDVFGFSRGASAARQFVNVIDQQRRHLLARAFAFEPKLRLKAGFDWGSRDDARIKFIGLFDTVVSSYLGGKRDVALAPDCAERVVHIIAADDWRAHFDLTRIKNVGSDLPPNFTEVIMPGAHSDIGGGYYSRWSMHNPNYADPALTEHRVIATFQSLDAKYVPVRERGAYNKARDYAKARAQQGWARGIEERDRPLIRPALGNLYLVPKKAQPHSLMDQAALQNEANQGKQPFEMNQVEVLLYRVVEGEYSRIPLHIMVEAARDAGVPFGVWYHNDLKFRLDSGAVPKPNIDLKQLDQAWVDAGKAKGQVVDLTKQLAPEHYRELRLRYLHYSAFVDMVYESNKVGVGPSLFEREQRQINANDEGGY